MGFGITYFEPSTLLRLLLTLRFWMLLFDLTIKHERDRQRGSPEKGRDLRGEMGPDMVVRVGSNIHRLLPLLIEIEARCRGVRLADLLKVLHFVLFLLHQWLN